MDDGDYCCSDDEYYNYSDQDFIDEVMEEEGDKSVMSNNKGPTALVITKESLVTAQEKDIQKVMEMLSVKESHARTLLIHHRWNLEKLFGVYGEKGKFDLLAQAGVIMFEPSASSAPSSSLVFCEICLEDVPRDKVTTIDCGHYFCNPCWTSHFIVNINEGKSKRIKCMAHKCKVICDENIVRDLVGREEPNTAEKFERFLLESYIEDNKKVKWCPSVPHCGNAISVEDEELCEVECSCGFQFCFSCTKEAHSPCSCSLFELWLVKCRDESETVNWITAHTKPCPHCNKSVEKNGGCNWVSCICGGAFCWICGGGTGREHSSSSIAGHSCGRYTQKEKEAEFAKRNLIRYVHYHNRYKAHMDSLKLEGKLKETMQGKVARLEEKYALRIREYSWVNDGLSRLFRSRRVLCYSYPFAYYMFGGEVFKDGMSVEERQRKQNLFEDQQQQLEANVERLSKYLEERFDEFGGDKVDKTRDQVVNLSSIVDNLCEKMYECIENDLLGSLNHQIAPYNSNGIEKASQLLADSS